MQATGISRLKDKRLWKHTHALRDGAPRSVRALGAEQSWPVDFRERALRPAGRKTPVLRQSRRLTPQRGGSLRPHSGAGWPVTGITGGLGVGWVLGYGVSVSLSLMAATVCPQPPTSPSPGLKTHSPSGWVLAHPKCTDNPVPSNRQGRDQGSNSTSSQGWSNPALWTLVLPEGDNVIGVGVAGGSEKTDFWTSPLNQVQHSVCNT